MRKPMGGVAPMTIPVEVAFRQTIATAFPLYNVAGVPKAPGAPAVTLLDPTVRVLFAKSDNTAVKYSAFVKNTAGGEVKVPLAVKPVVGSTTQLFALVAPDPPELPQGGIYTLQVSKSSRQHEHCIACLVIRLTRDGHDSRECLAAVQHQLP